MGIFNVFSEEQREIRSLAKEAEKVMALEPQMQALSDDQLREKTSEYRNRLQHGETEIGRAHV